MVIRQRVLTGLLLAGLFGVAAGLFKGNEIGLRAEIGNLSAPWLLVAFLPALSAGSMARGAVTGLTSTLLALLGFYAALTGILMDHLGDGGYVRHFVVEIGANRIYLLAGLVTGPLFGALGAWVGHRFRRNVWLIVGSLTAGEIAVVALIQGHELLPAPWYFEWSVDDWAAYVAEFALGVSIVLATLCLRHGPTALRSVRMRRS